MKKHKLLVSSLALMLLTACAPRETLREPDWAEAVQTAESREAHERLAQHYDKVAQQLQTQAEEERRMLDKYIAAPHKYGKRILDLKAHAQAEVNDLELAAEESRQMAKYHREMAREAP